MVFFVLGSCLVWVRVLMCVSFVIGCILFSLCSVLNFCLVRLNWLKFCSNWVVISCVLFMLGVR